MLPWVRGDVIFAMSIDFNIRGEQWLKAGCIEKAAFFNTDDGTPQGGIISPVLANMTLDGMERLINERYKYLHRVTGKKVRY